MREGPRGTDSLAKHGALVEPYSEALHRLRSGGFADHTPVCPKCGHEWGLTRDMRTQEQIVAGEPRLYQCLYGRYDETLHAGVYCPCQQTAYIARPLGELLIEEGRRGLG